MTKAASIRLTPNQVSLVKLGRALFEAQIELAEKRGYIQRVHEMERVAEADVEAPAAPGGIEKLRKLMAYSPEKEANQIIDVISPDLMDQVLGKPGTAREE
jgi:hypothetical protein